MQITKAVVFALLGLASASPVKRTAAQIQSDLATISKDLATLDKDVKAFTGSIFQGIGLISDVNSLEGAITSATSDVKSTGALSVADSTAIFTTLSSLSTQILTLLTDTQGKVCLPYLADT
jgi:hypothetical protein